MNRRELARKWSEDATAKFAGKKIEKIVYTDTGLGLAPVIWLEDGSHLVAMADDEGNGPGALHTSDDDVSIIPTIR